MSIELIIQYINGDNETLSFDNYDSNFYDVESHLLEKNNDNNIKIGYEFIYNEIEIKKTEKIKKYNNKIVLTIKKEKKILKKFVQENIDEICWQKLSRNPNAIELLENNLNKMINWYNLSQNPNAINILEKNFDKGWQIKE